MKKNPATSEQGKASLLHRHASLRGAEVNEKQGEEGLQLAHALAPGPPKAFLFLPPPTAATPAYSKMTLHEPPANFQASARCISLSHAQAIPSITRLYFQEMTRIRCLHTRTQAHARALPLPPRRSQETPLALPLVGSMFPMLARCMVGESKTNPFATLTSPQVNSLR